MKHFYIFCSLLLFISCKQTSKSSEEYSANSSEEIQGYEDGEYCAEIDYYYSKTGTRSTYTLKVDIENNELTKIYWPNGGWLDSSHFYPPDISDGYASFESDQGVEYDVRIIGEDGECSYSDYLFENSNSDNEDEICPECGDSKYSSDDLCSNCKDKKENICSECGAYEYYVYGGKCKNCKGEVCPNCGGDKFSSFDEVCSECERKLEEEEEEDNN